MNTTIEPTNAKADAAEDFFDLRVNKVRIKLLRKPSGYVSSLAMDNLGYQMQYSIDVLESDLAKVNNPHVLQLNLQWQDDDWQNPTAWKLYADGFLVASGTGDYARNLFQKSADAFLQVCRRAVEKAGLAALSEHDYRILSCARAIAAHEPPDGDGSLGSRINRVF
ncbi:hypothetical protein [Adlercreutzia sp. ZJ141]|uniref:hypothetical protein n=1 Tax=Adlercreutzia sp. ZJ141 TaxID=2709406 RepID=UPI0013EBFF97|nr:hypothetical protein [Adlercreutzia sp. ZJ141]